MPSTSIKKEIPCSKENLIKMVLDIEKYPEFVPWCLNGKIHSKNDKGEKIEIIADLTIGKSFFNETFKSFVIYDKPSDSIHVTNIEGPLKRYVHPDEFQELKELASSKGFLIVASSPLTRSSYHADEDFLEMKKLREAQSQCHQPQ